MGEPTEQAGAVLSIIREAEAEFRFRIVWLEHFHPKSFRDDVSIFCVEGVEGDALTDEEFIRFRGWLENRNWTVSRQRYLRGLLEGVEHTFIAPMQSVAPKAAFHATRTANLKSILDKGLHPGNRESRTTDRLDAIGNIYVTETLGFPGDCEREAFGTAHWWREHLSQVNRYQDSDWSIVSVDISEQEFLSYRDIWSETGIILRTDGPLKAKWIA